MGFRVKDLVVKIDNHEGRRVIVFGCDVDTQCEGASHCHNQSGCPAESACHFQTRGCGVTQCLETRPNGDHRRADILALREALAEAVEKLGQLADQLTDDD